MDRVEPPAEHGTEKDGDARVEPGPDAADAAPAASGTGAKGTSGSVALAVAAYVGARLVLLALIAGLLVLVGLPTVVALLVAVVISLPLSLVLFRGLRARLNAEVDAVSADRRDRRRRLRAELRGD